MLDGEMATRVRELRRKGWTLAGIARYLGVPESDVRCVLGERLQNDTMPRPVLANGRHQGRPGKMWGSKP